MKERNTEFFMKEEKGMKFKKVMALIMSQPSWYPLSPDAAGTAAMRAAAHQTRNRKRSLEANTPPGKRCSARSM